VDTKNNNRPTRLSMRESKMLDSMFGSGDATDEDFGLEIPDEIDSNGFEGVKSNGTLSANGVSNSRRVVERSGNAFMETKMLPFTIMTDGNTATQVVMLLEMIRYCMENSSEIVDSRTGEAKEYDIHLKVRNRGKSNFLVSIGDEPMAAIPVSEEPWFIGN
jgi:hypothetical protein